MYADNDNPGETTRMCRLVTTIVSPNMAEGWFPCIKVNREHTEQIHYLVQKDRQINSPKPIVFQ